MKRNQKMSKSKMKTYSAKQLSLFIAGLITILAAIIFILQNYLSNYVLLLILAIPLFAIITYFTVLYILNNYIHNKIKPIYKAISEVPLNKKKEIKEENLYKNAISVAREEVEQWTQIQVKEIERLKDLERYRKEFVGNVSHELKTPIFNIQGYILTLLEGGLEDPKINILYLKRTEKSIDRMISIVEDLESITKLESGELELRPQVFDIVKLIDEVFELEQIPANELKTTLEFSNKPEKPVFVKADKKRMMEVVTNLVINAIKYGKKKGKVIVSFYDLDDNIMIEVRDNGIGIDAKNLPRIFERFYRVDKSRSREQGGTGLGLSIVKHIIEGHNQTINVKSTLGKGTTFTFTLEKAK